MVMLPFVVVLLVSATASLDFTVQDGARTISVGFKETVVTSHKLKFQGTLRCICSDDAVKPWQM